MTKSNFLIYGSYGYTGNLIAELACKQGLKPVLGGRNKDKLAAQAAKLGLQYKHFDLDDLQATKQAIQEFITVIHCAGPFIKTYKNMAQACLETKTHYMDVTGEYLVIENLSKMHQQALSANIMLLPGAGFDVVPSDCLAQYLKNKLPDATHLTLAIHSQKRSSKSGSSISRGTARTFVEGLAEGSMVRSEGKLKQIPLNWKQRIFNFNNEKLITCTTIAWGDLASAWWSTRIPNIETYMATSRHMIRFFKLINPIRFIFKWRLINKFLMNRIDKMPEGPSQAMLKTSSTNVYGEVVNAAGNKVAALIQTLNGYELTAWSTIVIVKKTLAGQAPIGFQTPSTAYSKNLILEMPGTTRIDII